MLSTRRRWWAVVVMLIAGAGCSGAGNPAPKDSSSPGSSEASKEAAPASKSRGTIGVSLLTFENPFFKVIADHIEIEGKKQGYEVIALSADEDTAKQSNQVKDFVTQKVAAIVLSPCESRAIVPAIQEANAAGIPVFTVDIPCQEPGVTIVSQIATDNVGGGREAGQAIIEALGAPGGTVAILHYKQAESCRMRVQGFREAIDAHNAAAPNKIEIVGEYEGGAAKDDSAAAMKDALQSHDGLRAVFAINDPSALGARAALEQAGKADQVIIVGFDGQPEAKQAIKDGKIYADPIQFPDRMGIAAVEAIVAHSKGKDVPALNLIPTKLYRKADADADPDLK